MHPLSGNYCVYTIGNPILQGWIKSLERMIPMRQQQTDFKVEYKTIFKLKRSSK